MSDSSSVPRAVLGGEKIRIGRQGWKQVTRIAFLLLFFLVLLQRGANGAFTKCFRGGVYLYVTPNYQVDTTIPKLKIDRRHSPPHRLFYDQWKVFSWI